jgi:hypothetical protein
MRAAGKPPSYLWPGRGRGSEGLPSYSPQVPERFPRSLGRPYAVLRPFLGRPYAVVFDIREAQPEGIRRDGKTGVPDFELSCGPPYICTGKPFCQARKGKLQGTTLPQPSSPSPFKNNHPFASPFSSRAKPYKQLIAYQ